MKKVISALTFIPAVLFFILLFAVGFLLIFLMLLLAATGLLAIPLGAMVMLGIFTNVASDLAPPAIVSAGFCCVCAAVTLGCSLLRLLPAFARIFRLYANSFGKIWNLAVEL